MVETIQLLVFRIGRELCAFYADRVREIVHMAALSQPPTRPSSLEGFLNLAGSAVPVLRLDRLLRLQEEDAGLYTPIVILRGFEFPLGTLVHELDAIVSISEAELLPVSEKESLNACVRAQFQGPRGPVHLLDIERILLEQERRRLAEFQALEQARLDEMEVKA